MCFQKDCYVIYIKYNIYNKMEVCMPKSIKSLKDLINGGDSLNNS